ncbi:putative amino acid permease YecA [Bacillus amyloliquefaciens]|uniref:APC family permease n=1 Tax=Bacillus amyloliquefaciens TaxID=1390 RepID=UPI00080C5887|nr:amino acid permease [Bacillus amyloliquefaciens]OCB92732.1 putative amino acid permease YecA [Bacillus amyloliquefaciens]
MNTLRRSLTWVQGTALTIGAVLGCGILILPSVAADTAGPASLAAWLLMSLAAFPIVGTLSALVQKVPSAGGITAYAELAFQKKAGAVSGWIMLGSVPIGVPIIALTGAQYITSVTGAGAGAVTLIAAAMLALSLLLHLRGLQLSAGIGTLIICLIILLLAAAVAVSLPHVTSGSFHPFLPHGWHAAGSAAVMIFFSFVGWEMIMPLAEEFKHPKRDIPISLFAAAACVGLLYTLTAYVTVGTHAYGDEKGIASLNLLMANGMGRTGVYITACLALFITFSTVHANIAGFSRMVYAMSREGHIPKYFDRLHQKNRTPVRVLTTLGAIFFTVLLIQWVFQLNPEVLLKGPSAAFIASYVITMAAGLKLLRRFGIGWWSALASLGLCIGIYSFSGWAFCYPILLGLAGLFYNRRK